MVGCGFWRKGGMRMESKHCCLPVGREREELRPTRRRTARGGSARAKKLEGRESYLFLKDF